MGHLICICKQTNPRRTSGNDSVHPRPLELPGNATRGQASRNGHGAAGQILSREGVERGGWEGGRVDSG